MRQLGIALVEKKKLRSLVFLQMKPAGVPERLALPRGRWWTEESEINMQNLNTTASQRRVAHLEEEHCGQFVF